VRGQKVVNIGERDAHARRHRAVVILPQEWIEPDQPVAVAPQPRDDLYGRGLRRFLAIEQTHGLGGVLSVALGSRLP